MRTLKELAKLAYDVQDACNLSGVVHSFSSVMTDLWKHANELGEGTDWVNTHPVAILFADKVAHLTGTQTMGGLEVYKAYEKVRKLMEQES